jgi:hypothetical protein
VGFSVAIQGFPSVVLPTRVSRDCSDRCNLRDGRSDMRAAEMSRGRSGWSCRTIYRREELHSVRVSLDDEWRARSTGGTRWEHGAVFSTGVVDVRTAGRAARANYMSRRPAGTARDETSRHAVGLNRARKQAMGQLDFPRARRQRAKERFRQTGRKDEVLNKTPSRIDGYTLKRAFVSLVLKNLIVEPRRQHVAGWSELPSG